MGITYKGQFDEGNPPDRYYEDPGTGLPCPDCWKDLGLDLNTIIDDEVRTCKYHRSLSTREWDD